MSKHTPGQWYWDFDRDGLACLRSDAGDGEAIMIDVACYLEVADRLLIAAAPDLLEALEALLEDEEWMDGSGWVYVRNFDKADAARKAIARARGEA